MTNRSRYPKLLRHLANHALNQLAVHGKVTVGDNFRAGRGCKISSAHGLSFGDNVSVGPRTIIQVSGTIGDYAMIGMGVQIVGREDHAIDEVGVPMLESTWVGDRPPRPRDSVKIGMDVWIGGGATILSGIEIGDGAIVGAGSVLTRDVTPFAIVAGVPAVQLGTRFSSDADRDQHLQLLAQRARR